MAEVGGTITAGSTSLAITDLSIHDPINDSGQLAFWAATSQGDVIIRATGLTVDLVASQNPGRLGKSYTVSAEIKNELAEPDHRRPELGGDLSGVPDGRGDARGGRHPGDLPGCRRLDDGAARDIQSFVPVAPPDQPHQWVQGR